MSDPIVGDAIAAAGRRLPVAEVDGTTPC